MKDEQLESMCRSLFDILQRSLRMRGRQGEKERERERMLNSPKDVNTKTWQRGEDKERGEKEQQHWYVKGIAL